MRSTRSAIAILVLVAGTWAVTGRAQSPHPFGQPSASQPQPGSQVKAVPGSRAQGWLSQGRSEVPPEKLFCDLSAARNVSCTRSSASFVSRTWPMAKLKR